MQRIFRPEKLMAQFKAHLSLTDTDYSENQDDECHRSLKPFEDLNSIHDINDKPEWIFRSKIFFFTKPLLHSWWIRIGTAF